MDKKKKIGQKIWELFSENYSYSQIAKELGISKSVVSNIINYSLPPRDWCHENIKELKNKTQKEKEKLKQQLAKRIKELKKQSKKARNRVTIIGALTAGIISIVINILILQFDITLNPLNRFGLAIIIAIISFFIIKTINSLWEEE